MKKLYTQEDYKRPRLRSNSKKWRRKLRSKDIRKYRHKAYSAIRRDRHVEGAFQKYKHTIKAPVNFSLRENPNEVIFFVRKLNRYLNNRESVVVDLLDITNITHDAIVVLLSIMVRFKKRRVGFNGTFPNDKACQNKLRQSSFLETLYNEPDVKYNKNTKNVIRHHGKNTHGEVAQELIKTCSQNIWKEKRRCQGVYRT